VTAFVIAVDGPAASGKGTIATRLGAMFGLPVLDTGLLYRGVGVLAERAGVDLDDPVRVGAVAQALTAEQLDDPALRTRAAGELASRVAVHPEVRAALLDFQRSFAARPGGAVLDGRDIGTVICPDADVKIFITASLEARAKRRHRELQDYGITVDYQSVYDDLVERDERDAKRAVAPMKPAADAHVIDTSELSMQEVFDKALDIIR